MSAQHRECREIEPDLLAVAAGEAPAAAAEAVQAHVGRCVPCRGELRRYQAVEGLVAGLRHAPLRGADPTLARAELESRLADLRRRVVAFGIFASPLGPVLIARTEEGVSAVEYLDRATVAASSVARMAGADLLEDPAATEALFRDLLDYLEGRRIRLDWPLDLRWSRSEFQRRVLQATARLPYGAVTSYAGIARQVGAPTSTRAVAQALRRNPVPIAIPCHRVIGSAGDLVGYAGDKVTLKGRLLSVEGVATVTRRGGLAIERRAMYACPFDETEYCLPTCGSLPERPLAELVLFGSNARAEAAGLTPCTSCRPDLHPLSA